MVNKLFMMGLAIAVIMSLGYWAKPFEMDWDFGILAGFGIIVISIFIDLVFPTIKDVEDKKEAGK